MAELIPAATALLLLNGKAPTRKKQKGVIYMNRYAMIKDGVAWQIVEAESKPDWPPTPEGEKPFFAEIPAGATVEENFIYDGDSGGFTPYEGYIPPDERPEPEPQPEPATVEELKELALIQMEATAEISERQQEETLVTFDVLATIVDVLLGGGE